MYTVFLTGGIGSGKSTVSALMREKGARVVSLDDVAHEVLEEPQVKLELARRFGEDVLDWPQGFDACWIAAGAGKIDVAGDDEVARCLDPSVACTIVEANDPLDDMCLGTGDFATVNRARLAERAFATPEDTAALNAITHPRILARLGDILTGVCCMGVREKVTVVEVPLIESSLESLVLADEVLAIACPRELRRKRAQARGMAAEDFDERDARQITDEERARIADEVIVNDGDERALANAVDAWWAQRAAEGWRIGVPSPRPSAVSDEVLTVADPAAASALKSPAVSFVGRHNSGKTTLVTAVIAALVDRGVDVGSVKHHGHRGFDVDVPGKDSWRHREAGANEVAVCSPDKFALIRELDEQLEATEIVNMMRPHDVVIVEGYRHSGLPAIEIMRSGNERDTLAAGEFVRAAQAGTGFVFDPAALGRDADRMPDGLTVGVASDMPEVLAAARACGLQAFDLNDPDAIAAYIVDAFARNTR